MKKYFVLWIFLGTWCGGLISSSLWADIIPFDRMIDWSQSGVIQADGTKGIPFYPACPIPVTTADTIQAAIDQCPNYTAVVIPEGTFNVTNLRVNRPLVIRGAGPHRTSLIMGGNIRFEAPSPYRTHVVNWTSGYNKGETVITLSDTSRLSVGLELVLDQRNDPTLVNPYGNNGTHCGANNGCGRSEDLSAACYYGYCASDVRAMPQMVRILSCNEDAAGRCQGTSVTIDTPLYYTHQASLLPQAFFWEGGNLRYAGIEDIRIDAQYNNQAVSFPHCTHCWAKGIEVDHIHRGAVYAYWSYHMEIRDSYFFHVQAAAPTNYGLEFANTSASLIENNIFNETIAGIMLGWPNSGAVVGYNYTVNSALSTSVLWPNIASHDAHNYMNLIEGNVTPKIYFDFVWGSSSHQTVFRNALDGFKDPLATDYYSNFNNPLTLEAWNRYFNIIGNVLGKSGIHDVYEVSGGQSTRSYYYDANMNKTGWSSACASGPNINCISMGVGSIFALGNVNAYHPDMGSDDQVKSTLLRGGNFDFATNSVIWQANAPDQPAMYIPEQPLPASLYLSSRPTWWGTTPWPPIGPDVAPRVNKIPAQQCYENTLELGLAFNPSQCYANGASLPVGPPVIVTQPADQQVVVDQHGIFSVIVNANPAPLFQWYRTGHTGPLPGGDRPRFITPAVTLDDNGTAYWCVITNTEGAVTTRQAVLSVTVEEAVGVPGSSPMRFLTFPTVFKPLTDPPLTILYSVSGDFTLTVYDRRGKEVRKLNGDNIHAEWDGKNDSGSVVSAGTYMIVLKQGGHKIKKKVMVVK